MVLSSASSRLSCSRADEVSPTGCRLGETGPEAPRVSSVVVCVIPGGAIAAAEGSDPFEAAWGSMIAGVY
jgi:hypothetical protein